jgi:hypothetical protein
MDTKSSDNEVYSHVFSFSPKGEIFDMASSASEAMAAVGDSSSREFGIRNAIKKLNRQLEKVAYSFGNFTDI